MNKEPIGIIDSGIGGFTVAKSLHKLLPQEDIVYFGDGANAPYGNRSPEELIKLAKYMVSFMNEKKVKLLLVACNTISCLASSYEQEIVPPVLYVVRSGAKGVAERNYKKIAVISTQFTHQQGLYGKYIRSFSPEKEVFSGGSTHLVRLIEQNQGDEASELAIQQEAQEVLGPLVSHGVDCCVLGCTHYPLALDILQKTFPNLPFSDPAETMALEASALLRDNNLYHNEGGKLTVYTTGDPSLQIPHLKRADLQADAILHHTPLKL
ncbi:MAG: glutamate racemase [Eubacteriales bacterium]